MTAELDPLIHPTHRLKICAILAAGGVVETSVVRESLRLSASALSKQIAPLVEAGYVQQDRSGADSRRVWLSLTRNGKRAYEGHVRALRVIVAGAPA